MKPEHDGLVVLYVRIYDEDLSHRFWPGDAANAQQSFMNFVTTAAKDPLNVSDGHTLWMMPGHTIA